MADIAELQPLVGRWATTITLLWPADAKGEVRHAVDTYRWLAGGQALVHEVETRLDETAMQSIEIYTVQDGAILSRNVDGAGQVSDYRAAMADGVWRIEGETERFASTAIGPDAIEGLWEQKAGDGWRDWMRVGLDRVA